PMLAHRRPRVTFAIAGQSTSAVDMLRGFVATTLADSDEAILRANRDSLASAGPCTNLGAAWPRAVHSRHDGFAISSTDRVQQRKCSPVKRIRSVPLGDCANPDGSSWADRRSSTNSERVYGMRTGTRLIVGGVVLAATASLMLPSANANDGSTDGIGACAR